MFWKCVDIIQEIEYNIVESTRYFDYRGEAPRVRYVFAG
jgi:hypothetical protein